jgi:hypothetical protein
LCHGGTSSGSLSERILDYLQILLFVSKKSEMKEFSDLHFTVSSGFTQRSGHYKLTTDIEPKEISVTTRHLEHSGQSSDRSFPGASDEETSGKPADQGEQNTSHKSPAKNPLASQPPRFTPIERLPGGGSKYTESVLSKKVLDALSEDIDPAKSLADIRRVLVGPTRRLHEARMEEVIAILEESDRNAQQSLGSLEQRYGELARSCEKLFVASDDTQRRLQDQAMHMNSELQKNQEAQQQMLSEMFMVFDKQLEKLTTELNQKIDSLAERTVHDNQLLANELTRRIQELAANTRADNDKVAAVFDARLTRSEAHTEKEQRRQIEVFADGFSDIADRLLALRGVQGS